MDLDEAADELYAANPDDFMAARTALAERAKEAGDKALAKQITALRKPTRSAWLVNLVARAEPDRVAELVGLGAALHEAQQAMDGDTLRRLSRDRRTMIDTLAKRAGELGRDRGYPPPDGAIQEVSQSLQAALGDPAIAEQVQAGRLASAVAYGGFGPDDLGLALAASMPAKKKKAKPNLTVVPDLEPDEAEDEDDTEAREAARQARTTADAARAAAEEAEAAADEATTRADDLADRVEDLRRELRDTENAEREAREEARAARKHYTELRRAAAAAEQAAVRAEENL
ncbi:MAG TPA: hypothetical protein VK401_10290 [Propionibacteriaceae bacterium]|jgi:hypothetical protein|nr:hypothetical protein [Propionibacteriaceae bacterium]